MRQYERQCNDPDCSTAFCACSRHITASHHPRVSFVSVSPYLAFPFFISSVYFVSFCHLALLFDAMIILHLLRVCLSVAFLSREILGALPDYIKPCKRRDPDISKCIANTIESLRDRLAVGMPEFDAPAIEPLVLDQIRLVRGPSGARLDINVTNLQVKGPSTFMVRDLKADVDNVKFTFKVAFHKLNFDGNYQIDARLLLLKLSGKGNLEGNFTGYDSDVVLQARKVFRDNDVYLHFDRMKLDIKIDDANVYLNNLFGGDPVLGPASNQILNSNSALLLDEIRPVLESSLADLFTDVANNIVKSFTYNELFPDE